MASFSIIVTSSPLESQGCYSAYRFVQAALENGHSITGVFFYQSGVEVANAFQTMLSDELALYPKWCKLADKYTIPLQVCVTAANRRGILSQQDAIQNDTPNQYNLNPPFQSVGIGELVSMLNESDRSIQF
ncbi:sulfurtransferase complex subunit TusD [Aliiglaciecola sp. 3_MG-2023]|uniref:sulfurtransferase complex subunit TusD n=1 Tax=Aliiglaciecola sp. 3_MG-2023 TaxID=3062644 RepID=UPI0026E11C0D|nr:sulfurtransferase complex subunit TusD [Aliiglaciecola sp. 3_MG-2023]MDO6692620.1 sulfurtransferase complex subunit TusD [Aliiglaciecola sp. 3_MG-2023]